MNFGIILIAQTKFYSYNHNDSNVIELSSKLLLQMDQVF